MKNNANDRLLLVALAILGAAFLITLSVLFVRRVMVYRHLSRYIAMEIERSDEGEKRYWIYQKRRLLLGFFFGERRR